MSRSIRSRLMRMRWGWLCLVGYIGTILGANWAIDRFGFVPVGFGYEAPAGVYFAGLAFTFRDLTQSLLGKRAVLFAIPAGALLSLTISTRFALASGFAFLVSELADFAVYTPLQRRGWLPAVALSNIVGLAVDSVLFLWLAFGSLDFVTGQIIGKAWMTVLAIVVLAPIPRRLLTEPGSAPSSPSPAARSAALP